MQMHFSWLHLAILAMLATTGTAAGPKPAPSATPSKVSAEKLPGSGVTCDGSRPVKYQDCDFIISKLEAKDKNYNIPECLENGKGYTWSHGNCLITLHNKTPNWGQHCAKPDGYIKRMRETLHSCSPDKSGANNNSDKREGHFHWTEIKIGPNNANKYP